MTSRQSRDLPARVFLKRKSKMAGDCCVFKFLQRSVNGKHLMCFQSETFVFKFLRRSVDGKHLMRFQSETSVFKFLRRSVDRKPWMRFLSETSCFKFLRRSANKTLLVSTNEQQIQD